MSGIFRFLHPGRLGLVVLVLAGAQAHATGICVTNATELKTALTDTSDSGKYATQTANSIWMATGLYSTGSAEFAYYSSGTRTIYITGGYNHDCSAVIGNPDDTVLDGHDTTGVLSVTSAQGYVGVQNLTLQNGKSSGPGAGLQINYLATVSEIVSLSRLVISNNHSTNTAGGVYAAGAGNGVFLTNCLIANNRADTDYGAGYVATYGMYNFVVNNTVVKNVSNAASSPIGGLDLAGTTRWDVYKNIFWNNTGVGIQLDAGIVAMLDNDYGSRGGSPPFSETGRLNINPQFVDATNGNFRLDQGSPLIGVSSFLGDSGVDLDGHGAPAGGRMDLGTYYETIFVDDFDS